MKFLCIPCDVKMEVQTEGIMPEEKQNLTMKFKCKKCGHSIAMLTNKFETEFVSKLGVEMGGSTDVSKSPMAAVSSSLARKYKSISNPAFQELQTFGPTALISTTVNKNKRRNFICL